MLIRQAVQNPIFPLPCPQSHRFSFRLAIVLLTANLIYSGALILVQHRSSDLLCTTSMLLMIGSELACVFATGAIALNLLLVFVLQWTRGGEVFERMHLLAILAATTIVPMIGLGTDSFGRKHGNGECWFYGGTPEKVFAVEWACLYLWIAFCSLFSIAASMFVWASMYWRKNLGLELEQNEAEAHAALPDAEGAGGKSGVMGTTTGARSHASFSSRVLEQEMSRDGSFDSGGESHGIFRESAARIAIYCIIPFISQVCNLALDGVLYAYRNASREHYPLEAIIWLVFFANITSGLQGSIFSLVFLTLDPAIVSIRADFRRELIAEHCLPYVKVSRSGGGYHHPSHASRKGREDGGASRTQSHTNNTHILNQPDEEAGNDEEKNSVVLATHDAPAARTATATTTHAAAEAARRGVVSQRPPPQNAKSGWWRRAWGLLPRRLYPSPRFDSSRHPPPSTFMSRLRFWTVWITCVTDKELRVVYLLQKRDQNAPDRSYKSRAQRLSRL
ncbi:hypothetical protein DFJ77DRAFT_509434 [Powellomyces hirtus]|nr:hypothetical protein DFJ77DRAFT_509434 [Powellomyces hirtus]